MTKKITISLSAVLVSALIFLGSALRHSNVSGEPFLSEKNLVGAVPVFLIVLAVMAVAFLVPWEEFGHKGGDEPNLERDKQERRPNRDGGN
ncbi:MAG TPA: hypothetical protein VFF91_03020 [Pseudoxanthomonas sp.]|nr:hypothetical protein [Pseudoxanthomonas sp.]